MNQVLTYSLLLVAGLVGSQLVAAWLEELWPSASVVVRLASMTALAFIMIHVGYEFAIDRSRPQELVIAPSFHGAREARVWKGTVPLEGGYMGQVSADPSG